MHISPAGLLLIERFEGFSSKPYWDSLGGVWTRGFGETEGIHSGSPAITVTQGSTNLKARIERYYEPSIRALGVELNQDQWDALCSFTWNLGAGIFQGTTIGAELRARNWLAAANSMLAYDHAGGEVVEGLKIRREAERRVFLSAVAKPPYVPADEQRWRREWETLRGHRSLAAHRRRVVLKRTMIARAEAIEKVAKSQRNGWHILNRQARFDALKALTG
jgi:lysozyme